jgi:membrane associated rhomboid family serine protease
VNLFILLVVFLAVAFRVTKPDDRKRYAAFAIAHARQLKIVATTPRPDYEAFTAALRERTPRLVLVPALIAINAVVFAAMLFGAGSLADPSTLLRWGANLGTRTTNGEWWRLLTSAFITSGLFSLALNTIVLLHLGAVVERLVGRSATAAVYVSAGVMSGLRHVSAHPIDVGLSTVGALFGLYGFIAACALWQIRPRREAAQAQQEPTMLFERPVAPYEAGEAAAPDDQQQAPDPAPAAATAPIAIPLIAIKRIAVVGMVFFFFSAIGGFVTMAELTGFFVGAAYGLVFGWWAADRVPAARAIGATCAAWLMAAVAYAVPLRNIADVKPELERVRATESRTTRAFQEGLARVSRQRLTPDELADVADFAIVPELEADDARLQALRHVPPEHQQLVADAREFLRLRCTSWRARAEALRKTHKNLRAAGDVAGASLRMQAEGRFRSTQAAAGKAEAAERAASEAFARLKPIA